MTLKVRTCMPPAWSDQPSSDDFMSASATASAAPGPARQDPGVEVQRHPHIRMTEAGLSGLDVDVRTDHGCGVRAPEVVRGDPFVVRARRRGTSRWSQPRLRAWPPSLPAQDASTPSCPLRSLPATTISRREAPAGATPIGSVRSWSAFIVHGETAGPLGGGHSCAVVLPQRPPETADDLLSAMIELEDDGDRRHLQTRRGRLTAIAFEMIATLTRRPPPDQRPSPPRAGSSGSSGRGAAVVCFAEEPAAAECLDPRSQGCRVLLWPARLRQDRGRLGARGLRNARRAVPLTSESRWAVTRGAMKVAVASTGSPATSQSRAAHRGPLRAELRRHVGAASHVKSRRQMLSSATSCGRRAKSCLPTQAVTPRLSASSTMASVTNALKRMIC